MISRVLQEALRFTRAEEGEYPYSEGEGREVASRRATNRVGAGLLEGVRPRSSSARESADAERLFLGAPEEREIDPAHETDHGEVGRLAAFRDRLDHSRRQKPERQQPPNGSAIDSFPLR